MGSLKDKAITGEKSERKKTGGKFGIGKDGGNLELNHEKDSKETQIDLQELDTAFQCRKPEDVAVKKGFLGLRKETHKVTVCMRENPETGQLEEKMFDLTEEAQNAAKLKALYLEGKITEAEYVKKKKLLADRL